MKPQIISHKTYNCYVETKILDLAPLLIGCCFGVGFGAAWGRKLIANDKSSINISTVICLNMI